MKTLEELKKMILPLPCLFAEAAHPDNSSDDFSIEEGFGQSYSQDVGSGKTGRFVLRDEINFLGQIASAESFVKQSGGINTYNSNVSSDFSGYPKGALLSAFDGEHIEKVESTESSNTKAFADENGLVIPNVINCAESNEDRRVLWRSVSHINGVSDGLFHLNINFSNARQISNGDVVEEDCLLIGECIFNEAASITEDIIPYGDYLPRLFSFSHDTNITGQTNLRIKDQNKGMCGAIVGSKPFLTTTSIINISIPRCLGGSGNYCVSTYVKGGSTISVSASINSSQFGFLDITKLLHLIAIPINATIDSDL